MEKAGVPISFVSRWGCETWLPDIARAISHS